MYSRSEFRETSGKASGRCLTLPSDWQPCIGHRAGGPHPDTQEQDGLAGRSQRWKGQGVSKSGVRFQHANDRAGMRVLMLGFHHHACIGIVSERFTPAPFSPGIAGAEGRGMRGNAVKDFPSSQAVIRRSESRQDFRLRFVGLRIYRNSWRVSLPKSLTALPLTPSSPASAPPALTSAGFGTLSPLG